MGATTAAYLAVWTRAVTAARHGTADPSGILDARAPGWFQLCLGAVTNFFDALGIGSFAPTTAVFKLKQMVPDRIIPGTLNVGHALPTIAQAFIYTSIIEVDTLTLYGMIGASAIGAWLGAGVVAHWPRRRIQIGIGVGLLVAATVMFMTQLRLFPAGGEALGVRGLRLAIAVSGSFVFGSLQTLGIGLYAPSLILVSLLGMSPRAAFPIMTGSGAFVMAVASMRFIRERSYSLRVARGLAIGGVPGVLLAAYVVRELPLYWLRWLVVVVVIYTAVTMLWSARADRVPLPDAAVDASA
ncbi:MAG TPA: sulfite exporter TauE/SafE family protein [Vicinamibacterales bacterium]|nr:sulfite exporter TauE/SafE family protein [Vicinamibacterales bacterium]